MGLRRMGRQPDLAWDNYDWSAVKPGQILRFYMTPTVAPGEWWCVSVRHGQDWGNLPDDVYSRIDQPENNLLEVTMTQAIIDDFVANGGLVLSGQGYILNKVTIE